VYLSWWLLLGGGDRRVAQLDRATDRGYFALPEILDLLRIPESDRSANSGYSRLIARVARR